MSTNHITKYREPINAKLEEYSLTFLLYISCIKDKAPAKEEKKSAKCLWILKLPNRRNKDI